MSNFFQEETNRDFLSVLYDIVLKLDIDDYLNQKLITELKDSFSYGSSWYKDSRQINLSTRVSFNGDFSFDYKNWFIERITLFFYKMWSSF